MRERAVPKEAPRTLGPPSTARIRTEVTRHEFNLSLSAVMNSSPNLPVDTQSYVSPP